MAKLQKKFEVTIPFTTTSTVNGRKTITLQAEIEVCGVGYYYPSEPADEQFDFDIDELFYKDNKSGLMVQLPISVAEALAGDSLGELDYIANPILSNLSYLFLSEKREERVFNATPKTAHQTISAMNDMLSIFFNCKS